MDEHVQDAVKKGAKVMIGGRRGDGNFYQPTVLANVTLDAEVNRDETFGPLAACVRFSTEAEVIALANDTEYGLAGYVPFAPVIQFLTALVTSTRTTVRIVQTLLVHANFSSRQGMACRRGSAMWYDRLQHWNHQSGGHSIRRNQRIVSRWFIVPVQPDVRSGYGKEGSKYGMDDCE